MKGTYTPSSGAEDLQHCGPCDAGQYCHSPGLTAPQGPCEPGFYCTGGSHIAAPVTTYGLSHMLIRGVHFELIDLFIFFCFLFYRLAPDMVTYAPWVITVQQAPDTLMSTPVLLEPGVMHWGPRLCRPVGSALLDSSVTALASFSPLEYVLQVQIHNVKS